MLGTPIATSIPSSIPTSYIPSLEDIPYSPHCETYGLDYSGLVMDTVGIGLEFTPIGAIKDIASIRRLYSITEVGVDLFKLDFKGGGDWYNQFSAAMDFVGIIIPLMPDAASIIANIKHSTECVEPK
jgi:hypothetical protein